MARKIKVLGVQIGPDINDKQGNIDKVEKLLQEYACFKPDIVVLPEVFNTGVTSPARAREESETVPGPTYNTLSSWAKDLSCYMIAGSFTEKCKDGKIRNNSVFFNSEGKEIANYYKLHMFNYYGSREGEFCSPGNQSVLVKTPLGNIGMSVCFDLRFSELYRHLASAGAEILAVPAAWPYPRLNHWVTLNKARAIENLCFVIAVNQTGVVPPKRVNVGNSMIIDPWGCIVAGCGEEETVMMATIDLDMVTKLREEFPLLKDRRLEVYSNMKIVDVTN